MRALFWLRTVRSLPWLLALLAADAQPPLPAAGGGSKPADWPMEGYNAQHTHTNVNEREITPATVSRLAPLWQITFVSTTPDFANLSPVEVVDGLLYLHTTDSLYALDARTRALHWQVSLGAGPANAPLSAPATVNGLVYINANQLSALDARTGALTWSSGMAGGSSSPVVADGVVYAGTQDAQLLALDAASGKLLWRFSTSGIVWGSPAVANGIVYAGTDNGQVYALASKTGQLLWQVSASSLTDSPSVANGLLYISDKQQITALDAQTGKQRWRYNPAGASEGLILAAPAVSNGIVYVSLYYGTLYALDAATGRVLWKDEGGYNPLSAPIEVNGVLFASSANVVQIWDARTGASKGQLKTAAAFFQPSLVIANGVLYVSCDQELDAFSIP